MCSTWFFERHTWREIPYSLYTCIQCTGSSSKGTVTGKWLAQVYSCTSESIEQHTKRNSWLLYFPGFVFRVQVSDDGMKSLVRLANGDMRKALNILQVSRKFSFWFLWVILSRENYLHVAVLNSLILLICFQSTAMAFDTVNEVNVYTCTGQPLRSDIANIVEWMLNEDFSTAYNSILRL